MKVHCKTWKCPFGSIYLMGHEDKLVGLAFDKNRELILKNLKAEEVIATPSRVFDQTISELEEYFDGKRKKFTVGIKQTGTPFQISVWNELRKIPYGKSISYGEQATRLNIPTAMRAVGTANGRNTISIIVPCHRVIGKTGLITGYAGGMKMKERLLELEGIPFTPSKASKS